jgi:dihydroflavonol-4-reductase
MDRLLITGASGFIGGALAEYFCGKQFSVRLLVRDVGKLPQSIARQTEVFSGDITQAETLIAALEDVDAVISAAGLLGGWKLSSKQLFEANVQGVENLILAAFEAGAKRFVQLSAGGVTGPLGSEPVDERYVPSPQTDYERTKWKGERRALALAGEHDLNLIVVRPTFTYGPGDPHKLKLFRTVNKGHFVFIGDGLSTVHPVYIDDLVQGIERALTSNRKGRSYILGGPKPVTKRELAFGIADALGVKRPKIRIPVRVARCLASVGETAGRVFGFEPPLTLSRVSALSDNWGYSIQQAREDLDYMPRIDLEEGLNRTVRWYQERGWL